MAGKGGYMPGGGRPLGSQNKVSADIKALAQSYGPGAIRKLAEMAGLAVDEAGNELPPAQTEATRAVAIKELLDRGFGKSTQFLASDEGAGGLQVVIKRFTPE